MNCWLDDFWGTRKGEDTEKACRINASILSRTGLWGSCWYMGRPATEEGSNEGEDYEPTPILEEPLSSETPELGTTIEEAPQNTPAGILE